MAPRRQGRNVVCASCGTEFYANQTQLKRDRKYCSWACRNVGVVGSDSPDRFWSFVSKSDGCWEWIGKIGKNGYGQFHANISRHPAHRWSWALANGPIPDGMHVCHHCDNKKCVRPDHLFIGTHADNMRDAWRKGILRNPPRQVVARGRRAWQLSLT